MGELKEELANALKVFLWNLWKRLDPATQHGIVVMAITVLAVWGIIAVARFLIVVLRDLGKVPFNDSVIVRETSTLAHGIRYHASETSAAIQRKLLRHPIRINVLILPAIVLLLLAAFGSWPYNFYILTRIVVCLTSIWVAIQLHSKRYFLLEVPIIAIALIFNPVAPFHLDKATWRLFNIFGAFVLAPCILSVTRPSTTAESTDSTQQYCTQCGVRLGTADSFCRRCGVAIASQ
jgi:ribosomal protein L40E